MPLAHQDASLKCSFCKWFHIGYEGKTCRITREVTQDTRACIEFQHFKTSPYDVLIKDKFLREMERSIQVFSEEYLKELGKELMSYKMSTGGKVTSLGDLASEEKLMELAHKFEVCQAYTDRVVEIKCQLNDKSVELQSFAKDAQSYIFSHYTEQVRGLKNETERNMFFRNATPNLFKAIETLDSLQTKANTIHTNLKDTHFSLCQTQDACKEIWKSKIQSLDAGQRSRG